jgi:molybdate/tungstate transport system ATP-binding protein
MLRLEGVSKKWGDFQIRDINLDVLEREYFIILGPTGSGKTLLLETIAGFHMPIEGRIYMGNREITAQSPETRNLGLVYQQSLLFPNKTVFENISYGLRMRKKERIDIKERVDEIASMLRISHLLDRYPAKLSGGEAQRVSIARALVYKPELVLLDEPLSALDLPLRNELMEELKRIHEEFGSTFIHVTHNQQEALILGDRIGILKDGSLLQTGSAEDIFRKPKSEFVANFVAVDNLFKCVAKLEKDSTRVEIDDLVFFSTDKKEGKVHASIRPEEIIVSRGPIESSARNCFNGKITEISDRGTVIRLVVDVSVDFVVYITRQSFLDMNLNVGSDVYINFKATAVNLF